MGYAYYVYKAFGKHILEARIIGKAFSLPEHLVKTRLLNKSVLVVPQWQVDIRRSAAENDYHTPTVRDRQSC